MPCRMPACASSARRRRKMANGADRRLFWGTAGAGVVAAVVTKLVGSVVGRVRRGQGVVEFVDGGRRSARWPTFDVADSAITVGAIALAVSLWLEGRAQERAKEARAAEP